MSISPTIGVGMIGSGFMGRCHAQAMQMAPLVFNIALKPRLTLLADIDLDRATTAAQALKFQRATDDWRELIDDDDVELVDITAPNVLHEPIARAAIEAGKAVYCEKPLAPSLQTAISLAEAAEVAGVPTFVGFNYLKNPMVRLARDIIANGEIGEVWSFRGIHAEDYMSDPNSPWTWRHDPKGGAGALSDLGSHIISLGRYLVGEISEVCADLRTVIGDRPVSEGASEMRRVETNDEVRALIRFASGATGTIEASWVATGRKMNLAFEIYGSLGALVLDMERLNEIKLYRSSDPKGRDGFRTILAGPAHASYAEFCPAPGHQLGFNDIKAIEVKEILEALASKALFCPDFKEAARIEAVVDAMMTSAATRQWASVQTIA